MNLTKVAFEEVLFMLTRDDLDAFMVVSLQMNHKIPTDSWFIRRAPLRLLTFLTTTTDGSCIVSGQGKIM